MTEKLIKSTLKTLKFYFYGFYVLAFAATTFGIKIMEQGLMVDEKSETGVMLSSLVMIFVLVSVPLSLSLFNKNLKKLNNSGLSIEDKILKYKKASLFRISVLGIGLFLGVIMFYVLHANSMLMLAGISAIGLIFCKPAEVKLISDLNIGEDEEPQSENNE